MKLLIDGQLSFPPSEVSSFRDVTLYSSVFAGFEVLIESKNRHKDQVWNWLKQRGAHDFVLDIVPPRTEYGVLLGSADRCNICVQEITTINLRFIINHLKLRAELVRGFASRDDVDFLL